MKLDTIICRDNAIGLTEMPAECVALTVTSPPYGGLRKYNGYHWDFVKVSKELYRVTKPGGVVVWVVGDTVEKGSETGDPFRQALGFKDCGFLLHDTMIYAKHNPPPVGGLNRYYQAFEYMFVFSKGAPRVFNPLTEPRRNICNDKRTIRTKGFTRNASGEILAKTVAVNHGDPKRRNVWTYLVGGGNTTDDREAYKHPAMYPEQLAMDHILSWSEPGDLVLDPFMGSGTTAKAAKLCGRHYVGFEISPEYCNLARERVAALKEAPVNL